MAGPKQKNLQAVMATLSSTFSAGCLGRAVVHLTSSYMARTAGGESIPLLRMEPLGVRGQGANPAPSTALRLGRRLLLREVRAGSVGGVGRDDPRGVLRLGGACEFLAEKSAEGLGVDADFLGERLGRECVGHGAPFVWRCIEHTPTIQGWRSRVKGVLRVARDIYKPFTFIHFNPHDHALQPVGVTTVMGIR